MVAHEMQQEASQATSLSSVEPLPAEPLPAQPLANDRPGPTHEEIVSLAYVLWQQRGCPEGSSEEDWFRAEQELLGRSQLA